MYQKALNDSGFYTVVPKPTEGELKEFYNATYFLNPALGAEYPESYDEMEIRHKRLLSGLILHAASISHPNLPKNNKRFLDAGCGEGFTLALAHQSGWEVQGLDFTKQGLEKFNSHLLPFLKLGDVFESLKEMISKEEKYDVCILQHVLEHVIDPQRLLLEIKNLMAPSGIVSITVPNDYSSVQLKALEQGFIVKEFWFCPPEHLNYFNISTGITFLEKNGFRILDYYSSFPIDFFLFHPGSNYVDNLSVGKHAARARIILDLCLAQKGIDKLYEFYRALARCGGGRTVTFITTLK